MKKLFRKWFSHLCYMKNCAYQLQSRNIGNTKISVEESCHERFLFLFPSLLVACVYFVANVFMKEKLLHIVNNLTLRFWYKKWKWILSVKFDHFIYLFGFAYSVTMMNVSGQEITGEVLDCTWRPFQGNHGKSPFFDMMYKIAKHYINLIFQRSLFFCLFSA